MGYHMSEGIIFPHDAEWQARPYTRVRLTAAVAPTRDHFAVTLNLEGPANDLFDPYSRFVRYERGQWSMVEIPDYIASMALDRSRPDAKPWIVLLTREGEIHFANDGADRKERLPGAGISLPDSDKVGTLNRLRSVGGDYWACGSGRTVYRRRGSLWTKEDASIRMATQEESEYYNLNDVASPDGTTYYLAGSYSLPDGKGPRRILYYREGGGGWQSLVSPTFEDGVNALFVEDENTIWLLCSCSLQSGNRNAGFVNRAPRNPHISYGAMASFAGVLYVGSTRGLFRLHGGALVPVLDLDFVSATGGWIRHLIAADDVLWIFGDQGVVRYDGIRFEPIIMPSMGQDR